MPLLSQAKLNDAKCRYTTMYVCECAKEKEIVRLIRQSNTNAWRKMQDVYTYAHMFAMQITALCYTTTNIHQIPTTQKVGRRVEMFDQQQQQSKQLFFVLWHRRKSSERSVTDSQH